MIKRSNRNKFIFNKNIDGFSLIEVLIVLIIIAILVVAALPQIQQSLRLYRVETASGLLANRLTEARLTAIKYNRAAWLEINTTSKSFEVWTTDKNNQPVRTRLAVPISDDVSIVSGSPSRITFNSLGRNQSNSNEIIKFKLANSSFCRQVSVSIVGNITSAAC